jgi:diguanylate cyclase (GGDEF)-like protein
MVSRSLKLGNVVPVALAFFCTHALAMVIFKSHATTATYPFLILASTLALLASSWQARVMSSRVRLPWVLFSIGLLLWTTGIMLSAWEELFQHISSTAAFFSDFVLFLYGVPVLLSISSSTQEQRIPLFVWLDGIQAVLTAYLTYITLFAVVPFTTRTIHPISESLLMWVYTIENLVLACAASLRLLARPKTGEERRFFQILCGFLWIYAICVGIYNYSDFVKQRNTIVDAIADIPFLFLAIAAFFPAVRDGEGKLSAPKKPLTLFIDSAVPIFYTAVLIALGIAVIRSHFYIGIIAIIVALAVYGIRTTTLQSRYMQSQHALQEARDRLEEMSLKDGLTNVANRRCFDQVLELEWHRATRSQQPLSLLLIDIDFFKMINDRYGHTRGDDCLVNVAIALQSVVSRNSDLLARYGGEEFAVILPGTDSSGAKNIATCMQDAVAELEIANESALGRYVTLSIGIATYQFPGAGTANALLETSDQALYRAKEQGRNRIELSAMPAFPNASLTTG